MKKFFSFFAAVLFASSMMATEVVFDFSDASAFGYENPAPSKFAQVPTGGTIAQDGVVMTITFASGNGFRFFANTNTGVINLRGYVGAEFEIKAPEGKSLFSIEWTGSNHGSTYVEGDIVNGAWSSETGATSVSGKIIKSTVQINTMKVVIGDAGDVPVGPTYDTLTVAEAIAATQALADGAVSPEKVYVEGYVVFSSPYSKKYGNQIFFMADDAAAPDSLFEAYAASPVHEGAVLPVVDGDKVRAFGFLKKYVDNGNKIQLELDKPSVEFIEMVPDADRSIPEPKLDTITVAQAMEIGNALKDNATTPDDYVIKGFVTKAYAPNEGYTDQNWYMADEPDGYGEFEAYRCTPDRTVEDGDYVLLTGAITKYVGSKGTTIEVKNGKAVHAEAPVIEIKKISIAEAVEIGMALENEQTTEDKYEIEGIVANAQEFSEGVQSFNIVEGDASLFVEFAAIEAEAKDEDKVRVIGKIQKYEDEGDIMIIIVNSKAEIIGDEEGIEHLILTEQAQKVVVDGVLYIVRDNKLFNVQGGQVR